MKYITQLVFLIFLSSCILAFASGDHNSQEGGPEEHQEEARSNIGPEKGIIEKSKEGFKLSPEATVALGIQTILLRSDFIEIPITAIVKVKDSKSVFRLRQGWYKRVEFQILQKKSSSLVIHSHDLKPGDEVLIASEGFLRTAEIYSEEGATHSH